MNFSITTNWQYPKISRRSFIAGLMAYSAFPAVDVGAQKTEPKQDSPVVVRGPYLQRCHPTGVVIMWYTDLPTVTQVRFGPRLGELGQTFKVEGLRRRHVARINNLSSQSKYYYSVGTEDEVLSGGDPETYFYTAPPVGRSKDTRIWVLGDSGDVNADSIGVRDSYYAYTANRHTDLCLMLGDNAYPNGTEEEYQAAVFDMFAHKIRQTPLWPAYGNHEARCVNCVSAEQVGPFFEIFKTPMLGEAGGHSSTRRDFYSFDYGNIHFVCLNSHDAEGSHMVNWLEEDLQQCRAAWLIAYWHHPPYSRGYHDSDIGTQERYMRQHVLPVLETHGVDLVLTGHNHNYERSYFINGHYKRSNTLTREMVLDTGNGSVEGDGPYTKPLGRHPGTVYIAAGCASEIKSGPLDHPVMALATGTIGSLVIDIEDDTMDVRFLDQNGNIRDEFQIRKSRSAYFPLHYS